jgi:predicted nuclease of predicted toxin-antitoxin system
MVLLYANENFPRQVVEQLRQLGHDVLTVPEAGQDGQGIGDADVLEYATRRQRAVITLNRRDFIQLHLANPEHAGIIVCTQDADIKGQARRVDAAIQATPDLTGQLLRINRPPK